VTRACLLVCALLAVPATAQELAGPEVEQTTLPGSSETFGGEPDRMDMAARVPMDVFVRALRSLQPDESTRLTDEQLRTIMEAMTEFRRNAGAFEREHRAEVRELRRRASDMDDPDREVSQEQMIELRERAEAMRRAAPDPMNAQRKIWGELNEAQRAAVEGEIEKWRAEQDEKAVGRMTRRFEGTIANRLGKAKLTDERVRASDLPEQAKQRLLQLPVEERAAAIGRARRGLVSPELRAQLAKIHGPVTDEMLDELPLPERARQRLANLTPEQRARVLRRFAEQGEPRGARRGGGERPHRDRSPEPPPMDRIPLPDPDDG